VIAKLATLGQGYRTYIIVGVFLLCVGVEKLHGIDIPGFDPGQNWLETVLGALGLGSLRAALGK